MESCRECDWRGWRWEDLAFHRQNGKKVHKTRCFSRKNSLFCHFDGEVLGFLVSNPVDRTPDMISHLPVYVGAACGCLSGRT